MTEYDFSTDPKAFQSQRASREKFKIDKDLVDKPLSDKIIRLLFFVAFYHLIAYVLVFWVLFGYIPTFSSYEQGVAFIFATVLAPFIVVSRRTLRAFDAACPRGVELWSLLALIIVPFFVTVYLHESMHYRTASTFVWPPYLAAILAAFWGTKWMIQDKSYIKALHEQRPEMRPGQRNLYVMQWLSLSVKEAFKHTPGIIVASIGLTLLGYFFGFSVLFVLSPFIDGFSHRALDPLMNTVFTVCLLITFSFMGHGLKTRDPKSKEKVFDSMVIFYAFMVYVAINIAAYYGIESYLQG